jgi:peptidoglycan biosynthesis protein MviN/MurJ (putative lipid II flippase)
VSFIAVALNLLFNWIFTFRLGWGHRGLAFSTGLVASCNFLVLYWLMHRHLKRLETRRMLAMLGKVALAAAALALVCWASLHWWLANWATQGFASKLGALLVTVVVGALIFVGCGTALRIEELSELTDALRRRLRRAV